MIILRQVLLMPENTQALSIHLGWRFVLASTVILLSACASTKDDSTSMAERTMANVVAEQAQLPLRVPPEISDSLLTSPHIATDSRPGSRRVSRFDVSVNEVPAKTFFVSLVADAGVNVVAHPEIEGRISLDLKNVTIDEVLSVTRDVYGYEYKYDSSIYTIYPRKLRTQVFELNYLDVKRVGVTDTSVQIGEITGANNNSGGRSSGGGGSGNSRSNGGSEGANLLGYLDNENDTASGGGGQGIVPGARVQTLTKTDFWGGIRQAITAIVGSEGGRMVMVNSHAGIVVVKALPGELSAVRSFLEKSELSVQRQVVLETKILEVRLNDGFEAGINWGAISGAISASQTDTSTSSLESIVAGRSGARDSIISSVLDITDITKLLFLLEKQGSVQVLSSPRISTVNNQKAVIRVGSDEFFVTGISNSTTSSASSTVSTPEVELESFFSGIALDVTPQISESGEVILHVHPIVTTITDQTKEIDIAGELFSLPLALRDVRESDSIVKARSGQVVVLGGLMQESTSEVDTKRAFIGDIPVLNLLFKAKQRAKVKTELVILMRPIVVDDSKWDAALKDQALRINAISEEFRSR